MERRKREEKRKKEISAFRERKILKEEGRKGNREIEEIYGVKGRNRTRRKGSIRKEEQD